MEQYIEVERKRSVIAEPKKVRVVLESMGLRKIGQKRLYKDNNCIRGMVNKVSHLVSYKIVEK